MKKVSFSSLHFADGFSLELNEACYCFVLFFFRLPHKTCTVYCIQSSKMSVSTIDCFHGQLDVRVLSFVSLLWSAAAPPPLFFVSPFCSGPPPPPPILRRGKNKRWLDFRRVSFRFGGYRITSTARQSVSGLRSVNWSVRLFFFFSTAFVDVPLKPPPPWTGFVCRKPSDGPLHRA